MRRTNDGENVDRARFVSNLRSRGGVSVDPLQLTCAACGAVNRVPSGRLADEPRCGKCKLGLLPGAPIESNEARFRAEVEASPVPVLVDFWAPWCGPCRAVAPVLAAIARERRGKLKIVKINVDENPQLAARFQARSIPMLTLFSGGRVKDTILGAQPKPALDGWLDQRLR